MGKNMMKKPMPGKQKSKSSGSPMKVSVPALKQPKGVKVNDHKSSGNMSSQHLYHNEDGSEEC